MVKLESLLKKQNNYFERYLWRKTIVENYENIPKEARESNKYDPTDPNAGKSEKTRIEKLRKDFEDQKKSIEERKAAKAEERAAALTRIAGRSENKLPEGIDEKTIEKEEINMKILVLNGSPKGEYSITLQTLKYLEKKSKKKGAAK